MPDTDTSTASETKSANTVTLNSWHFWSLVAVLVSLLLALLIVLWRFTEAGEAASILGIVVPAFATIGSAIFGVTIGYKVGETSGEKAGKEEGRQEGTQELAAKVRPQVERLRDNLTDQVISPLLRGLESPAGTETLVLPPGAAGTPEVELSGTDLQQAAVDVQTLAALLEVEGA